MVAAGDLFDEKGFEATTVDDIVAKAHISRMTFFNHFPGKDSVLEQLAIELFREHGALFGEMLGGEDTLEAALPPQLESRLDLVIKHRKFLRMVVKHTQLFTSYRTASEKTNPIAGYMKGHFETRLNRVRRAQSSGQIRDDIKASEICNVYDAIRNDVIGRWLLEDQAEGTQLKAWFEAAMKVFVRGLKVD